LKQKKRGRRSRIGKGVGKRKSGEEMGKNRRKEGRRKERRKEGRKGGRKMCCRPVLRILAFTGQSVRQWFDSWDNKVGTQSRIY
jgi:hypothetical protein